MPVSAALPNVSPLRPLSQGSRPLVAFPASAGAALRPGAAHEHEPAAAHEAGPVWHAHSVLCVPSSEPPQPEAQLPWSGPEQLGQAVLLLEVTPAPRVSSPFLILCKAHHCSSCFRCFGVSCSGTTQLDAGPLDSYLSEVSTPKGSGLVRPSVKRSSRSSSVTVFSCEGESPSEGLSASNRRRHLASSCNLAQCHPKLLLGRREQPC